MLVDYEYVPSGFDPDDVTAGFRGKHWFGDHLAVGATYVDDNRAGEDYSLAAGDITLQAGRGTYLKAEYTQTEATSAPIFYSDNGGLSFSEINSGLGRREGEAMAVEARANFKELGWTDSDWAAGAWWRRVGQGFSVTRFDIGEEIEEHGIEVRGQLASNFTVYTLHRAERCDEALTRRKFRRVADRHATLAANCAVSMSNARPETRPVPWLRCNTSNVSAAISICTGPRRSPSTMTAATTPTTTPSVSAPSICSATCPALAPR